MSTYRCNLRGDDLADGDAYEVEASSVEWAAEEFLTDGHEQSLASDIIGTDFDEERTVEVFVMDEADEDVIFRVEVRLTASVDYHAMAGKVESIRRESLAHPSGPPPASSASDR